MKVAIDARWIFREISGIGAYTRDLIRALFEEDSHNRYLLLFDDPVVRDRTVEEVGLLQAVHATTKLLNYGVFSPWSQLRLPGLLTNEGVDVYHSTNYMIPLRAFPSRRKGRIACVTTIHDVIPMVFPNHAPRSRKARVYRLYKRIMMEVGRRSDVLVTDSAASKRDILKHLRMEEGTDPERVRVVPCGIHSRFRPGDTFRPAREPSERRRLLYVGRSDPYKNVPTLVRAFAAARSQLPFDVELVIAGAPDPRYPEARQLASELGVESAMHWTGYLGDDELVRTYQEADALVHPSRYEGFGLQVGEAMACGVPVISSNAGSLPEVAGDATVLVDPDDVDGFINAIKEVLTDDSLARRLRDNGRRQAARFTWQRTARAMLAIYKEAAGMECHA